MDDEEASAAYEDDEAEEIEMPPDEWVPSAVNDNEREETMPKRRRIRYKQGPVDEVSTVGTRADAQLITKRAAVAANKRNAAVAASNRKSERIAKDAAFRLVARATETVNCIVDENGYEDGIQQATLPDPHPSHQMRVANAVDAIYCEVCGAWSRGRKKLRRLGQPCSSEQRRSHTIRLLQLGIVPRAGAVIPEQLKLGFRGAKRR